MITIIYAVIALACLGAVCSVLLIVAAKYMSVPVDEKLTAVRECLPGANCGACGYAGCDGYAEALASGEEEKTNLCIPGGDTASRGISDALGVEFADVVEKVAVVKCLGNCMLSKIKYTYEGVSSCRAEKLLYNGKWACANGCLGYGDCVKACPNGAISIVNGIAKVETKKCSGCGICTRECPNGLIEVFPDVSRVVVTCSNKERGAVAKSKCENACIGCKKCEKACHTGAIRVIENLAVIDYDKCDNCSECAKVCMAGCIKIADFSGIHNFVG